MWNPHMHTYVYACMYTHFYRLPTYVCMNANIKIALRIFKWSYQWYCK